MNRLKYFDKTQCIIGILAIATTIIAIILFIIMMVTGTPYYDESGVLAGIKYNNVLQIIFSMFLIIELGAMLWFLARTITYKMRAQEEEQL